MSHKLKRYEPCMDWDGSDYHPAMDKDSTGGYYKVEDVDTLLLEMQGMLDWEEACKYMTAVAERREAILSTFGVIDDE